MVFVVQLGWLSVKGLFVYATVLAAGAASMWLAFGPPPATRFEPWDGIPGIMGGAILMGAIVLGGLYVVLGGRV